MKTELYSYIRNKVKLQAATASAHPEKKLCFSMIDLVKHKKIFLQKSPYFHVQQSYSNSSFIRTEIPLGNQGEPSRLLE